MTPLRVLVVDDHPLMRRAVISLVRGEPDLTVAGEAHHGQEALELARALRPDLIMLDWYMPVMDGQTTLTQLLSDNPEARVLVLTSSTESEPVLAAIQGGALGYVLKDADPPELLRAIREVAHGRRYLPTNVAAKLAEGVRQSTAGPHAPDQPRSAEVDSLTAREWEVLHLVGEGLSNRAIADALALSEATVRAHLHHIFSKLGVQNRSQAALFMARQNRPARPTPSD